MRTTTGPTDHVVIVGAGLAGLSAAMHLAGAGREVTVLERESVPGGRNGLMVTDGYRIDTGPTVLTMPDLIADTFDALGETMSDWLTLHPVAPLYRGFFADGSVLDSHADVDAMAEEIRRVIGPAEEAGYRRFVTFVEELYRLEIRHFIDRNLDNPLTMARPELARLAALGGFGRLAPKVAEYLRDPRTQRLFSFQSLYAGVSPYDALAIYAVIAYMDSVAGVFFPEGGMHAVPRAMAAAAAKHGVQFHYDTTVTDVETVGRRATAVITADGRRFPADVVVLNPDLPVARRDLLGHPLRRNLDYSPSCVLLLTGSTASYTHTAHHNIHFGTAWRETFTELIDRKIMPSDPSFLVSNPTASDPTLAPDGKHTYYTLFMAPNLDGGQDWSRLGPRVREQMLAAMDDAGYSDFAASIEVERLITPQDWAAGGMERGAPFAAAHSFGQTGPFRPRNIWGDNVVFVGSGTQPGVGVPMVLISGRLGAERVTGPMRSYRSRAWR